MRTRIKALFVSISAKIFLEDAEDGDLEMQTVVIKREFKIFGF